MQQVNVFIETSSRFRGNVERKCGYVLSTQLRTGKETKESQDITIVEQGLAFQLYR